jgi:hypothetical protein
MILEDNLYDFNKFEIVDRCNNCWQIETAGNV